MSTVALIGLADFINVRAVLLPTQPAQLASAVLSDDILSLPSLGGRADAVVKERLGADWLGFASTPPAIPSYYAQGDPDRALQLMHDALVQFTCMQVIATGLMHQITPNLQKLPNVTVETIVPWSVIQANFETAGYAALNLLRRAIPVAGRTFVSPSSGAVGQMSSGIHTPAHGIRPWDRSQRTRW